MVLLKNTKKIENTRKSLKTNTFFIFFLFLSKSCLFFIMTDILYLEEEDIYLEEEEIPVVTVKLDPPIRNKILNYKQTVKNLDIRKEDGKLFVDDLPQCECSQSVFKDPVHNHVVTGDLRIIRNKKLRKLISKGPNFREKKFMNYKKCLNAIEFAID